MPYRDGSSAQRIRIGLTGLGAAFLIVLFASAISRSSHGKPGSDAETTSANEAAAPNEPLAELGVAPGAGPASNNSSSNSQ